MLDELHIRDVALIKEAWIEPGRGLTVFTGETGAGKTVLLNALKLIIGERGDLSLIARGADSARIEARFSDIGESGEVLATRQLSITGRNRCTLDDELVTVGRLSEVLGPTIDLHGQHDHQALLRPATHQALLDRWGAKHLEDDLASYQESFELYSEATRHLDELRATIDKSAEEIEAGRIVLQDIEAIDPQPGEDDQLGEMLPALQHAGELNEAIREAVQSLRGEGSALDKLGTARDVLHEVVCFDGRLTGIVEALDQISIEVDEASITLRDIAASLEDDDAKLEETQTRLGALDGLKRRFGPSLDAVLERKERLTTLLALTENSDIELEEATRRRDQARAELQSSAQALHQARTKAAAMLAEELRAGVISLDMEDAGFTIECEELAFEQFNRTGPDQIEILYQPAPNAAMRPLAKIASGGEISRVMLALKGVLGRSDDAQTLVFDEIDAGIGGAAATLIGRRLAHLAQTHQVLVVTHLAQVAVFADTHYRVTKHTVAEDVATSVERLDGDLREEEIARMLAGETGQTAREHARELFKNAQG